MKKPYYIQKPTLEMRDDLWNRSKLSAQRGMPKLAERLKQEALEIDKALKREETE